MNDTRENHPFPDETGIHDYVDGRLDEAGCTRMEAWLDRHPARAEEIRGWRRDAQRLRAALGGLPASPGRVAMDPATIRTRRRQRVRARMALAAMLVLTLGVGGITGWQAHRFTAPAAAAPMADALQAYRMFVTNRHLQLDVVQQQPGELQAWLDRHFHEPEPLPNLDGAGFRPIGGRLLATDDGPAAVVLYENGNGAAIAFYIRPPSSSRGMLPHGQRREGQLAAAYWSGNGYNYALVSRDDPRDVRLIQRASLPSSI